jgi:hypothetical protein
LDLQGFTFADLTAMLGWHSNFTGALSFTLPAICAARTPSIPVSKNTVDWARAILALFHFAFRTLTFFSAMGSYNNLVAHTGSDTWSTPSGASRPTTPLSPNSIHRAELCVAWEFTLSPLGALETSILWLHLDVKFLCHETTTTRE